jgi:hypothetical protein
MTQEWRCHSRNNEEGVIKSGLNNHYESINQWVILEPESCPCCFSYILIAVFHM